MIDRSFLRLIALVAKRDYLRTVRRRGFIVGTLLLPLSIGIIGGIASFFAGGALDGLAGAGGDVTITLANESSLGLAEETRDGFRVRLVDRAAGLAELDRGNGRELYILADDYLASGIVERIAVSSGGRVDLGDLQRRQVQENGLADYLRRSLAAQIQLPPDRVERLLEPVAVRERSLDGAPPASDGLAARFIVPYAFSTFFVISIFITSGYLLQSVTEEKENRVVEILLSSIPALPLMAGKIIGLGGAGLTQVAIWLATAAITLPALGSRGNLGPINLSPEALLLALVYFVLGYAAYGAIFSAIGALAPGTREAQQYSGFFGFFAVIPLILSALFLTNSGSPVVTGLLLLPLTAPASALLLLVVAPEPPWPLIGLSLAVLVAFVALATVASARIFRATLLLYGVRPSLRQLASAVFARD